MKTLSYTFFRPASQASAAVYAPAHDYSLAVPEGARRTLARAWLWLGVAALIGSGLFSILLVVSRTPFI